jgi:iron-sulfur cluster assembly protein
MVALTDSAKAVVRRLIERADDSATAGLRISVEEGGCAGLKYLLGVDAKARKADQVYDFDGARVFIDPFSLPILDGIRIDYVEGVDASGFVFDNPNIGNRCACGKSFTP